MWKIKGNRRLRVLAWVNILVCLSLYAASVVLYFTNQPAPEWRQVYDYEVWTLFAFATLYPIVGLLILVNQPRNVIGWILEGIGLLTAVTVFATQYAIFGIYTQPGSILLPSLALWLRGWLWVPMISLLALFLLLFPSGRYPSRRWRWVPYVLLLGIVASLVINLVSLENLPTTLTNTPVRNPPWDQFASLLILLLLFSLVASLLSLPFRWKEADALVRQQIKWVVFAGLLFGATFLLSDLVVERVWQDPTTRFIVANGFAMLSAAALAGAIFMAILRYRLFDIDVIIRRTTSYTILTALLALVYFGSIVVLQRLLAPITGESDLAVVLSTLLIAALFLPLRRRVQDAIDRRFFRRKYDAEKVLQQFAATARDETDLDALTAELLRVIQETMEPESVSLWLRQATDDRPRAMGRN